MYRKEYANLEHKCAGCIQYLVLAASPPYLNSSLNVDDSGLETPLVEGLLDDILAARFGIVVKKEQCLTDADVDDWFCDKADSELAVQYANGKSLLLLLCRQNAITIGQEIAKFHNRLSIIKVGKPAIYVSDNIISAQRDVRLHFPNVKAANYASLEAVRSYAKSHLIQPLVREIAGLHLHENRHSLDKNEIKSKFKK